MRRSPDERAVLAANDRERTTLMREMTHMRRVVLATDGSEHARAAV